MENGTNRKLVILRGRQRCPQNSVLLTEATAPHTRTWVIQYLQSKGKDNPFKDEVYIIYSLSGRFIECKKKYPKRILKLLIFLVLN
jgi:hypothetical protein